MSDGMRVWIALKALWLRKVFGNTCHDDHAGDDDHYDNDAGDVDDDHDDGDDADDDGADDDDFLGMSQAVCSFLVQELTFL